MTTLRILTASGAVLTPALNNAINDETGEWLPLFTVDDPLPEGFRLCTVEDIALKDVSPGESYQILEADEIPQEEP